MSEQTGQRLDKWLWFARVARSRSLASALVTSGKVRVNRVRVTKPSRLVRAGDVVTLAAHGRVRVFRIVLPGARRGPAAEAQTLYEDISPPQPRRERPLPPAPQGMREKGAGRPTKRDRRRIDALAGNARASGE